MKHSPKAALSLESARTQASSVVVGKAKSQ